MFQTIKRFFKGDTSEQAQEVINKLGEYEGYINKGNEHLAKNELSLAAECYKKAISKNPEYADAYLNMGFVLMEQNDIKGAEDFIEKALALNPSLIDAHYLLGKIKYERQELDEAIAIFNKALELNPNFEIVYGDLCQALYKKGDVESALNIILKGIRIADHRPDYHVYLGNLYAHKGELIKAQECYEKALLINPKDASILYNLGQISVKQKDLLNARVYFERALLINPELSTALVELAVISMKENKPEEAIASYRAVLKLDPAKSEIYLEMGNIWLSLRKRSEAIACYAEVVKLRPNDEAMKYLLDALQGEERSSGSFHYAEKLFDSYASNFNHHLTQVLQYEPMRLINTLTKIPEFLDKKYDVLDLGCGTGLIGMAVKEFSNKLVGVDVSAKMLSQAEDLHVYDRLEKNELLAMMHDEAGASYDLIMASDVFLYVGKLQEVFEQVRRLLRPKGFFTFSVEALDTLEGVTSSDIAKGFRLNVTARYAHSKQYIEKLAASVDLMVEIIELGQLRRDVEESSIQGWFVVCRA